MNKKRKNIGLFVGDPDDIFNNLLCKGAIEAAEELDVNLFIFPGKYLEWHYTNQKQKYEYQYCTLFSYALPENIDLLISSTGSIGYALSAQSQKRFMDPFKNLPIVTIASQIEGYEDISFDNKNGLKEGIEYLIKKQSRKNICMLSGPIHNKDATQRLEVYKKTLEENGIKVENSKIAYGFFTENCIFQVEELLDNNPDMDALVCANDYMAKGAYKVLIKRGIKIGVDILVIGFDDSPFSSTMNPPLASVHADSTQLGYQALKEGYYYLQHKIIRNPVLKTEFVLRTSAGIDSIEKDDLNIILPEDITSKSNLSQISSDIFTYIFAIYKYERILDTIRDQFCNLFEQILTAIIRKEITDAISHEIICQLDKLLKNNIIIYRETDKLSKVLERIYILFYKKQDTDINCILFHNLFINIYKKTTLLIYEDFREYKNSTIDLNHTSNTIMKEIMLFENGSDQSYVSIIENLHMLDIQNSHLYLFENPIMNLPDEKWYPPEHILLKAYQNKENTTLLIKSKQKMKTCSILRNEYFKQNKRYTMVFIDLYSNEMQYGLFLCDIKYEYYHYIEFLTFQLSAAIKTINLLQSQEESQRQLENNLEQLKANNLELDAMSKSDELTRIWNRRGFFQEAETLLSSSKNIGKQVLIIYGDMDNLKIINDRYGHDNGDFSLKICSDILINAVENQGVIGRIGGDEFAVAIITTQNNLSDIIQNRAKEITKEMNKKSKKHYYIQLTFGTYQCDYKTNLNLRELLEHADADLYRRKKYRTKDILK
jgi:diguanylate cyclase (GGDEF)-like protein